MGALAVSISNQWALTTAQSLTFGQTPSALQSTVIALNVANSVGGGSGTPTAGNWLVLIAGWNQKGLPAVTMAASDDAHAFWRPGNVTTSAWAVSPSAGNTRVAVWYTANPLYAALKTYAAPSGLMAGMAVLVVELSGTGPWDSITGINTNYAAAATTLNLTLGAPSASSFAIGAVCGDSSAAGQAFLPASWTGLHTTTATNGVDHTADAVLTSAILLSNSGSLSVNGTATSATDLAGVLIEFLISAPSPIPANQNPAWPFLKFEAAFGGGFQTPPDQLTWTDLTSRLWSWNETTGAQYQLGQIQATDLVLEIDNNDNALASDNTGSPYYSNALNSNMSFQAGISPWTVLNGTLSQSSAHVFASSGGAVAQFSMLITPSGSGSPSAFSEQLAVAASTAYTASIWAYNQAGWASGVSCVIWWYDNTHTFISTSGGTLVAPLTAATWLQATVTATSPSNAAFGQINLAIQGTPLASNLFYAAEGAIVQGSSVVTTGRVTTGVPIRIRAAVGTLQGVTANRWYVLQRNAEQWPQQIDSVWRRYVAMTATDMWSVMAAAETTPYRGEVLQDAPQSWWAMDDQVLTGGVLPSTLRNIAPGNTNVLNVTQSAAGSGALGAGAGTPQFYCNTDGWPTTVATALPSSSVYSVAQQQGWMYGDPQSVPPEFSLSSITTANPGSAAWVNSGLAGTIGSQGWYLYATDANFPALSGGATVECWFNYVFAGSGTQFQPTWTGPTLDVTGVFTVRPGATPVMQQPTMPLTIFELATASAPVAVLQLDQAGHLNLITYSGSTPTSNSIYTKSDLRSNSWHHVAITLTTTAWTAYVDGGATASVSGTATGMTSAWTALVANGDLGTGGSSSTGQATAFVQEQSATNATATTTTVTLNAPTAAGNCLVVCVKTANTTVTGITLGGAAGNFAAAKTVANAGTNAEIWTDANCTGGQTSVVVTTAASALTSVVVMEFCGIVTSSPVDVTASNTGSSANPPWSSGTTASLASASEIAVSVLNVTSGVITPPGASWTNFLPGNASMAAGWAPVSSTAGQVYSGYTDSSNTTLTYAAAIVTLKAIGLAHGGNIALSHLAVYPSQLPQWRVAAHYWAAFTAFGQIPAPQNVVMQWEANPAFPVDGSANIGVSTGGAGGYQAPATAGLLASAVVSAAIPSGTTSGPSPWAIAIASGATASTFSLQWTGVAPLFNVYTAPFVGGEKRSAVTAGNADSFLISYQNAALGEGVTQTSGISVVQVAQSPAVAIATPITVRFKNKVTAGNCIVVCIASAATSITSVTLNGAADHFASAIAVTGSSNNSFIWTDPNSAGGQTDVIVTLNPGGSNGNVFAVELSGVVSSTPVDKTAGQNTSTPSSGAITWTSTATAAQSQVSDVAIGMVNGSSGATWTVSTTDPTLFDIFNFGSGNAVFAGIAGLPGTTALAFDGTATLNLSNYSAAIITLKTTWTGGSPPTSATAVGDTPGQRIERCLSYGKITYPGRSIDPATLLLKAATDIGGQQTGVNIANIVRSDGGLLYVDNNGYLHYDDKVQLAAEPANAWTIGPATSPYYPEIRWIADPHRVWNAINITPFSPEGLTLASVSPSSSAAVTASQMQYGPQPLPFFSYLQSQAEMQTQANWLFTNYGTLHVRAENVRLDAAPAPGLWPVILGMNVGDPATVQMWQVGGGGLTWTMRISRIRRRIEFTEKAVEASAVLELDWEPPSYWS